MHVTGFGMKELASADTKNAKIEASAPPKECPTTCNYNKK
jgi:hypothetical protein